MRAGALAWRNPAVRLRRTRLAPRRRWVVAGLVAVVVLGLAWLWLRDSPVVSIDRVTVSGASGPDAPAIRSALAQAARGMTTLDLNQRQLDNAVAPYPEVKALRVSTQLPHGLRIRVIEQLAVAAVAVGGHAEAVAADGTLLHGQSTASLPVIALQVPPGGSKITDRAALAGIRALAAAPYRLLTRISGISSAAGHGLVAQLRGGPAIYLGDGTRLRAKWLAALAVLADPSSAGAAYVDVTDPGRPAAGAGAGG